MIQTPRDALLMETLGRFGVLSTEQLARMFFPDVALTTVRRRLRLLEDEGLIYRVRGLDEGAVAWTLTKKRAEALGVMYSIRAFNRNTLHHDVRLSEVRYALERIGLGQNWVPEHALKAQAVLSRPRSDQARPFVPDAVFSVQRGGMVRVLALELELSGKSSRRYEHILARYRNRKSLWAVWYLVPQETLGKKLESIWRGVNGGRRNDLLMWSELDGLLRDGENVRIRSEHFSYALRELVEISLQASEPALPGALPGSRAEVAGTTPSAHSVF